MESRLYALGPGDTREQWDLYGNISALVPCEKGGFLATLRDGIYHLDPGGPTLTWLIPLEADLPGNRFNDGYSDTRGNFWFGSMDDGHAKASGRFYRLDAGGQVHSLDDFGTFCITNGPTFSADGRHVYFTDTVNRAIHRAPLAADGTPGGPELFIDFRPYAGHPDGMCVDTEGGLWVCHYGGAQISRFSPAGNYDYSLSLPVPNITKCCFGGPDMATLFITTARGAPGPGASDHPLSGGLFAVDVPFRGIPITPVPNPPGAANTPRT
ncbi:MAG: SMP-30/gluconolactonase/LRE family protein [Halioglobus sp.]|nr:SMP-30/gluconolactonase/LRE family protein [Halioglobus sp.]